MKKRWIIAILTAALCLLAAAPAMAADVFQFTERNIRVFAGETVTPELQRDGKYAEGEVTFTLRNERAVIDENGAVTGVTPGDVYLDAQLKKDGKAVKNARVTITVVRKVTGVSLDTEKLQVYAPDDASILPLLAPRTEEQGPLTSRILVMPAGKGIWPRYTVEPSDVSQRDQKVTWEISDTNILRLQGGQLYAVRKGECDLIIRSNQNPEAFEQLHVLVTQPVKGIQVTAESKYVAAGKTLQLTAAVTPEDATIQSVEWTSKSPKNAEVDQNGVVTGIARGSATIEAKSKDGTNRVGYFTVNITQDVTGVSIRETDVTVATGRRAAQLHTEVLPQNASNKKLVWSSSDESIAIVRNGIIYGQKAGECIVTASSESNPEVAATIPVKVIQLVTDIQYLTQAGEKIYIGDQLQLEWQVLPEDASIKDVTFRSRAPKIAAVDANGIVTGLNKGVADIEAKAADGSGRYRVYRVTVLKAVEGIDPLPAQYYAPVGRGINIKATVYPRDASNLRILWSSSDESIATVRPNGTSYGKITGHRRGWVTITATTEDGGFSTSTNVLVDYFDTLITCNSARIDDNNKIRLVLWNMSRDYTVSRITMRIECFDTQGEPMVCNTDGESTYFDASYGFALEPGAPTEHGRFTFHNYKENGMLGYVVISVTGYDFDNGQRWNIPESVQLDHKYRSENSSHWGDPILKEPGEENG